jgi:hypothetical protein
MKWRSLMFNRIYRLALAGILAGMLPGASYGQQAVQKEVQLFPPGIPGTTMANINPTTICGAAPQGSTYSLVWDGTDPVWCSQVPTNCPAGEGLIFDGQNFQCAIPCEPTLITNPSGQCPLAGEVGSPGGTYQLQYCDGTMSAPFGNAPNTCGFPMLMVTQGTCTPGTTVVGSSVTVNGQTVIDTTPAGQAAGAAAVPCSAP